MSVVNPVHRAFGQRVEVGDTRGGKASPGKSPSSRLVDQLPQFAIARAYFHAIAAPLAAAFTGAAWFGLRRIRPRDVGQEFCLSGVSGTMLPTDSSAGALTGITTPLAWGDTRGLSAAIVIGKNLPCIQGEWKDAPAYIPGLDFGDAIPDAPTLLSVANSPEYWIVQGFPTGTFRDTAPNKPPLRWSFAPHVGRITESNSLDVALVVKSSQVNGLGAAATIVGLADFALTLGLVNSEADYSRR